MKPLCIDLFSGLGGWTEGFLAEGWDCVGFDIEQHIYGEHRYPAQLVLQDVRTIHGKQFKDADMIVASSPCQAYSYMAMPWSKAKAKARWYRDPAHPERLDELNELFNQPARIQREACEAAGRFIPMIQENVKGAQPWVGRAPHNYGSFYLWGDIPALMPTTTKRRMKSAVSCAPLRFADRVASTPEEAHRFLYRLPNDGVKTPGFRFDGSGKSFQTASVEGQKNTGGSWFNIGSPGQTVTGQNPVHAAVKNGGDWFGSGENCSLQRRASSKSSARKFASAQIAKIPFPLASHIARVYKPVSEEAA